MKKFILLLNLVLFLFSASGKIAEEAVEKELISFDYIGEEETK
jgi:hypothetical protein